MAAKREVAKGNRYGLPEIMRGLTAVAYENGNVSRAVKALKADGIKVSPATLGRWVKDNPADYERIRRDILPQVGAKVADEHMDLARKQLGGAAMLAERLIKEGKDLPIRDVAGAMRNFDVGAGIHTEKARELQGDFETPNKTNKTAAELLRALQARGVGVLDGEATEEPIEQLPQGDSA
jgi:hypothetical protein